METVGGHHGGTRAQEREHQCSGHIAVRMNKRAVAPPNRDPRPAERNGPQGVKWGTPRAQIDTLLLELVELPKCVELAFGAPAVVGQNVEDPVHRAPEDIDGLCP